MADGEHLVVFSDGVHYVIGADGNPDLTQPLTWENGGYRPALSTDPMHNDVHWQNDLELEVGGE